MQGRQRLESLDYIRQRKGPIDVHQRTRRRRTRPPAPESLLRTFPVWDPHVRWSHALITVLFAWQFLSGQFGLGPGWLHLWAGYALLVVVLFRIGWGLVGSDSARFSRMLPTPAELAAYLPRLFSRQASHWPGHNPVGAVSALLLLTLLLLQSVTGLFVETWGELRGPLAEQVGRGTAIWMNDLHDLLRWPLFALVAIHLIAVFAYWLIKKENRIGPMFGSGRIALPSDPGLARAAGGKAWLVWLIALLTVTGLVWLGPRVPV